MRIATSRRWLGVLLFATPILFGACDNKSAEKPAAGKGDVGKQATPAEKPKEPLVKKAEVVDWCKEHGVPESICTRCNAELIDGFKKKGDWCIKHGLPDSQCLDCHPELKAKFEAMKPKEALIKKAEMVDWCKEHGVPESICTRCNAKLIDGFKKKGDWCDKHGLPESQCLDCHPDLKAKFEAMKPKEG